MKEQKQNLVVLTGAGISAESGISTFRDSNGLWEGYDVTEVASPKGWQKNKELVLDFYNQRRKNVFEAEPNQAHKLLAQLEDNFNVRIITQNIDDLHERAGSSEVLHLHGEIKKARSTADSNLIYELNDWEIKLGDKCEKGSQLRPHIVWFGEAVPAMQEAISIASHADIFLIVGTSLQVYPAAGLINFVPEAIPKYVIDPNMPTISHHQNMTLIEEKGSTGMEILLKKYLKL